jgi:hypothetical protein
MVPVGDERFGRLLNLILIHGRIGARRRHVVNGGKQRRIVYPWRATDQRQTRPDSQGRRPKRKARNSMPGQNTSPAMHTALRFALARLCPRPPDNATKSHTSPIIYNKKLREHASHKVVICRNKDAAGSHFRHWTARELGRELSVLCAARDQSISPAKAWIASVH